MTIDYEDRYDEEDEVGTYGDSINTIEDQEGGTIVFNSAELMSANFDGGISKSVSQTKLELTQNEITAGTPKLLGIGDYIFWNFSLAPTGRGSSYNPISSDTIDGEIDESDILDDYEDVYLVTGIESNEEDDSINTKYNISILLDEDEFVIENVTKSELIWALKEDWENKELGDNGWLITSAGNAIFTNIAARGRIEATSGYLQSLDVNGVLRVKGTPVDPDGTEDQIIASLKVYQNDLYEAKEQGSVVVNKNGLIIRSKDPNTLQEGVNAEIIAKFPINGGAPKISGYTNDDGNPDNDNDPPDANGDQIVIGGKKNNITLNGGKGNKAIYTTIGGNRTVFQNPGSDQTTTGFLIQLIDTDDGSGETWNTRMRLSGANGSLTFDGSNLTVTGAINATSGNFTSTVTVGGTTSGTLRIGTSTTGVATITGTNNASGTFISIHKPSTAPSWANANTPFYVNAEGKFSLGNAISWDPTVSGGPPVLQINGILRGFVNETTGVPVPLTGTNAMGIGLFVNYTGLSGTVTSGSKILTMSNTSSLVSGMTLTKTSGTGAFASGTKVATILSNTQAELSANATVSGSITFSSTNATDGVVGIGIKINSTNYWFADGSPRMKIGTEKNYLEYDSSVDRVSLTGQLYTTRARISSFYIQDDKMFIPRFSTETASGVAFNSGGYGDTIQVLVSAGTIGNNNYVWTETSNINTARPILIGQISSVTTDGTYYYGTINIATGTSIAQIGEWSSDQIIRFSTSATLNDLRYSGFGSTNTYSIFAGATNSNGVGAQFSVSTAGKISSEYTFNNDVAGATNEKAVWIGGSGYNFAFGYNSSTQRVKQQIQSAYNEILISRFLDLSPVKYKYNSAVEKLGDDAPFYYGFIAEEAKELGLDFLYQTDEDGIPDYFAYEKMPVYLFTVVKYQQQKIEELEERLAILEG